MSLLSVIFALLAESFTTRLVELRRFELFFRYSDWLRNKLATFSFQNGTIVLIVIVASIMSAVWFVDSMLGDRLGLLRFLFGVAVLIFCLGPRDLERDVQHIIQAFEREDYEAAKNHAVHLFARETSDSPAQLARSVKESIFIQSNIRILGVFFWFIILGPIGGVLFRLSCLLKESSVTESDDFANASRLLYDILIWLPARICVLSYAIAGNFVGTMSYWSGLSDLWLRESEDLIIVSGAGALRYEQRIEKQNNETENTLDINAIQHALSLVKRAVIVWVVILALLTATGWLF